ncbi:MAG: N-glycosylase/DNA lyase [Candidatus Micrarchaeota archaeon]|nr:N-glycosylase/DNA lyase [Candidatus Micrarchaeota archaeon]
MESLLCEIKRTDAKAKRLIDRRWGEFRKMRFASEEAWFSELCFCILTANASAEMGIRVQARLGYDGFAKTPPENLAEALRKAGSRFYNKRAEYILGARKLDGTFKKIILGFKNGAEAREWLVKNVKGLGYKEASHFLRNVGAADDVAIIDMHVLRLLERHNLMHMAKPLGRKKYLEAEEILKKIAKESKMPVGKLDLYLWFMQTGKVLK